MNKSNRQIAMQTSINTIIGNVILTAFKLIAGVLSHSSAMISDAVHSASDVLSTLVVMVGIKMSSKDSDKDHPYGHERMESVAAIILAGMLCATGIGIGYSAIINIMQNTMTEIAAFGGLALAAAIVSIIVKEAMFWYTRAAAKKTGSGALMADAWHHRSDAFSSIGSFAGILGARLGFPILDPLAGFIICLFIVKAAYDIFMNAIGKMTDKACDEETDIQIRDIILSTGGVVCIDLLRTRLFGNRIYVDLEIGVDAEATLREAHAVAQNVHDRLEKDLTNIKHCMVHVNPIEPTVELEGGG